MVRPRTPAWVYAVAALFVLVLFAPSSLPAVKAELSALLVISLLVQAINGRIVFDPWWGWLTLVAASVLVFGVILGLLRGNPGAFDHGRVWAFALPAWAILGSIRVDERAAQWLAAVVFWSFIAYMVMLLAFRLLPAVGLLGTGGIVWTEFLGVTTAIDTTRLAGSIHSHLLAILAFGIPYVLVYALINPRRGSFARILTLLVVAGVLALGARRAFYVSVPLAMLYLGMLIGLGRGRQYNQHSRMLSSALHVLFIIGAILVVVGFELVGDHLFTIIDSSTQVKVALSTCLLAEFLSSPILGHGLGAVVDQCIRSEGSPWAYELSYHVMLMGVGLLGVFVFGAVLVLGGVHVQEKIATGHLLVLPAIAGVVGLLAAHGTNPYITKMEDGWVFALLGLLANFYRSQDART